MITENPTDKQINLVNSISETLDIPLPDKHTKQAYKEYIIEYFDEYQDACM